MQISHRAGFRYLDLFIAEIGIEIVVGIVCDADVVLVGLETIVDAPFLLVHRHRTKGETVCCLPPTFIDSRICNGFIFNIFFFIALRSKMLLDVDRLGLFSDDCVTKLYF